VVIKPCGYPMTAALSPLGRIFDALFNPGRVAGIPVTRSPK